MSALKELQDVLRHVPTQKEATCAAVNLGIS